MAKKAEEIYVLTFKGLLGSVCSSEEIVDGVMDALMAHFFRCGLGTDPNTSPAIVFSRNDKGIMGSGIMTEVCLAADELKEG